MMTNTSGSGSDLERSNSSLTTSLHPFSLAHFIAAEESARGFVDRARRRSTRTETLESEEEETSVEEEEDEENEETLEISCFESTACSEGEKGRESFHSGRRKP
jgi:hypothetical protein